VAGAAVASWASLRAQGGMGSSPGAKRGESATRARTKRTGGMGLRGGMGLQARTEKEVFSLFYFFFYFTFSFKFHFQIHF